MTTEETATNARQARCSRSVNQRVDEETEVTGTSLLVRTGICVDNYLCYNHCSSNLFPLEDP